MAKKRKDYGIGISEHKIEALAWTLLPAMEAFFERKEGKLEFEEWKKQKERDKQNEVMNTGATVTN